MMQIGQKTFVVDFERLPELMAEALGQAMTSISQLFTDNAIAVLVTAFSGIMGMPDEIANSAQFEIQNASEREFWITRHVT